MFYSNINAETNEFISILEYSQVGVTPFCNFFVIFLLDYNHYSEHHVLLRTYFNDVSSADS